MKIVASVLPLAVFLCSPLSLAQESVFSGFESGIDGWTVTTPNLTHRASGGNPGGFIFVDNPEGIVLSKIIAPPKFLGDLRSYDGGILSFDGNLILQADPDYFGDCNYGTITITGGSGSVSLDIVPSQPEVGIWTRYAVKFDAASWGLTQADWSALLANVTELSFSVEAVFGEEQNGIDNVWLSSDEFEIDCASSETESESFIIHFESDPEITGWRIVASADLKSYPADVTSATTITETSPGVYEAEIDLSSIANDLRFFKIVR